MCFGDFFCAKRTLCECYQANAIFCFQHRLLNMKAASCHFPLELEKNSRLLMFAAAILRSCNDRSVDRNYFSGVCNERKIIEKFSEHPIIRREKSEAMRLSGFPFPDLAEADPVFTVQSARHKHRQTAIVIVWKEWLLVIFLAI